MADAIEATWPAATVATCTVHLIRRPSGLYPMPTASVSPPRCAPSTPPPLSKPPRPSCCLRRVRASRRYPAAVATWDNVGSGSSPSGRLHPNSEKIIYTTNAIKSLNYQLRKIIKNRGHFATDDAVIKLLWLVIRDIEDKRPRQRVKEKGLPPNQRKAPRPPRRRRRCPRLKTSPGSPRTGLSRPPCPLPHLTTHRSTYTDNLTGSTRRVVTCARRHDAYRVSHAPRYKVLCSTLPHARDSGSSVEMSSSIRTPIQTAHTQLLWTIPSAGNRRNVRHVFRGTRPRPITSSGTGRSPAISSPGACIIAIGRVV